MASFSSESAESDTHHRGSASSSAQSGETSTKNRRRAIMASFSTDSDESGSNNGHGALAMYRALFCGRDDDVAANKNLLEDLRGHFNNFPASYTAFTSVEKAEDVLLHIRMLAAAKDFVNGVALSVRVADLKEEDASSEGPRNTSFEILFSAIHSQKLLPQLSGCFLDICYDVKEVHMFHMLDGSRALYVFNVVGKNEDVEVLAQTIAKSIIISKHCTGVKLVSTAPPKSSIFCTFCNTFKNGAWCNCDHQPPPRPGMIPRALRLKEGYKDIGGEMKKKKEKKEK